MEKYSATIRKCLLGGILVVLLLPLLQKHLKFADTERLHGAIVPKEQAWFSYDSWMDGTFQEQYGAWFNENFGFRNDAVRLHNQIAYTFYHEARANGVIIGKDGFLYESGYIKAYTGKDFIGYEAINDNTNKLKALQDSLEKKGITLLVCLAAGKASFYPEYIPEEYGEGSDTTNYKVYAKMLAEKQINCIDYNKWFMEMKGKTKFPLYPKTGIHWSRYGSMLATDSLIRYVEHKRNVDMPNVVEDSTYFGDTLLDPDEDIGRGMNITFPIQPLAMGHPVFHYEDTTGKAKVRLMTFSDSFFWNFYITGLGPNAFSQVDFYYYNKEVYHSNGEAMGSPDPITTNEDVEKHDVVVIMATEATLNGLGWGFIGNAFDHFVVHKMIDSKDAYEMKKNALIAGYERDIRMDAKWLSDTKLKAAKNNISLDSMISIDARFMADEKMKELENK